MKNIFMFVNVDWFFFSHRLPIAQGAENNNVKMTVFVDFTQAHEESCEEGYQLCQSPIHRTSRSVPRIAVELIKTFLIIKNGKPDVIHAVTIKPILILGIVARLTSTSFIGAVSGLGPAFSTRGRLSTVRLRIIIWLLRFIFRGGKASLICQSIHDRDALLSAGVSSDENIMLISGSGVDTDVYSPEKKIAGGDLYVLMASRILVDKGVKEFCLAAKMVQDQLGHSVKFKLSGSIDCDSPTFIPQSELDDLCKATGVEYLGNRKDMPELLASSTIFVLPSYYAEGVPKVLLEASACGVAIVTTDHPGCRDAVESRETGLLVPPRDPVGLAKAILELIQDENLRSKMGEAGRKLALSRYGVTDVVAQHYNLYLRHFSQ